MEYGHYHHSTHQGIDIIPLVNYMATLVSEGWEIVSVIKTVHNSVTGDEYELITRRPV